MSIWGNIRKKSLGQDMRGEDFALIYSDNNSSTVLAEDEYDGNSYTIQTNGKFPSIVMQTYNKKNPISLFSGKDSIVIEVDGKKYELLVHRDRDLGFFYVYHFNKKGDLIYGEQKGKAHSIDEMKDLAETFIEKIVEEENRLYDIMKNHS